MIEAHSVLGNGELDALDATGKLVPSRPVVRRDRSPRVHSNVATIIGREDQGNVAATLPSPTFLPSTYKDAVPPLPSPPPA